MHVIRSSVALLSAALIAGVALAVQPREASELRLDVNDVERTALVFYSVGAGPSPLLIFFHGFGDTAGNMAAATKLHELWPAATVVYPQGIVDVKGRDGRLLAGWQREQGDLNDRDLAFVDAMLERLRAGGRIDEQHVYAGGYSNGGFFAFTLLAARPEQFAAFASVACYAHGDHIDRSIPPRPVLYIFGREDKAFDDSAQCADLDGGLDCARRTRDRLLEMNGATGRLRELSRHGVAYYHEPDGAPTVWYLHPGGHVWPDFTSRTIVEFFDAHWRSGVSETLVDPTHWAGVRLGEACGDEEGRMAYLENRHERRSLRIVVGRMHGDDAEGKRRMITVPPKSERKLGCTSRTRGSGAVERLRWEVVEASFR